VRKTKQILRYSGIIPKIKPGSRSKCQVSINSHL